MVFDAGFIYDEQFMQTTISLNSSTIYGFGEHSHQNLKLDMNYTSWPIFTRDALPVVL